MKPTVARLARWEIHANLVKPAKVAKPAKSVRLANPVRNVNSTSGDIKVIVTAIVVTMVVKRKR